MRKISFGVAAGAMGLGTLLVARAAGPSPALGEKPTWERATVLAQPVDHPLGLALDGELLYFVSGGFQLAENAVRRLPAAGGPVETLATADMLLSGELALDSDHVYFSSYWGGAVLRVPKAGGAAAAVAQVRWPTHLAVDDRHVYFVTRPKDEPHGSLQRVAKFGGTPEVVLGGHAGLAELVVDAEHVYFRSNSGLWKLPKAGGAAQSLLPRTDGRNVLRLAMDATHLYFFLETAKGKGKYAPARLAKSGGEPQGIGPEGNSQGRLAVSDTHVYFFRRATMSHDLLARVPKAGGPAETVDSAGHSTGYLALGPGAVYFASVNTIYRVPR